MDDRHIKRFIEYYTKEIEESNAAIFAGAGLSRPAGFVNWKELMKELAEDIELDVEKEHDLIAVAQYHVNEFRSRGKINRKLIDEFAQTTTITENHKILARLPIRYFWTTNYDQLIEQALRNEGKQVDVKISSESMTYTVSKSNAIVYKMHGDISQAEKAVLTKDDYEMYNVDRRLFTIALQGDLVSKTFLFVGFSFDDPNLEYILSRIRILLGENQRPHYCLMKRVSPSDFKTEEEYRYAEVQQRHKINDLKRFSINVLLVEEYSDITVILKSIEEHFKRKNVFISGTASNYGEWGEKRTFEFSSLLSKKIIQNNKNIVSGFGLGIGSSIIAGALEEIYSHSNIELEERLKLKPFPQQAPTGVDLKEMYQKHRQGMLSNVGIAIFIFGNKLDKETNTIVEANGMIEEFEIATNTGIVPIPVGITGFTAQKLWEEVINNFEKYVPDQTLKTLYESLADKSKSDVEIVDIILEIIKSLSAT